MRWLDRADGKRENDYDGRGRMSDKGLYEFCYFFLSTALDQINFMTSLLDLDGLEKRIEKYLVASDVFGKHVEEGTYLLREAVRRGEFPRGATGRITNRAERTARDILKKAIDNGLLVSDSKNGAVRLAFPAKVLEFYFPLLYPQGIHEETAFLEQG